MSGDLKSMRETFLVKPSSDEPVKHTFDMVLSSIDISFFTLPLCFHSMGAVMAIGFYWYMLFWSLMASQCYIELKRLSKIAQKNNWDRDHVGIIDLIDECCENGSHSWLSPRMMNLIKWYLKSVVISTLILLLACNYSFTAVMIERTFQGVLGSFTT